MNTRLHLIGLALVAGSLGTALAAEPIDARAEANKAAAEGCEAAVTDTVKEMRGREAQEVQFIAAKRALRSTTGDETEVKGAGRYRGATGGPMAFTYSCAFNATTNSTSGVVFRDAGRVVAEPVWQPDMASVSPEACETVIAATLKSKYPRVGRIAFGSDSRQLKPAANIANSSLQGQGAVERAPGMSLVPFTYSCEFESRSGKIVAAQTSD